MDIQKEEGDSKGRMVAKDGAAEMGEMTFSVANDFIIVDHTEVAEGYQGQGVGKKLFWALVEMLRKENRKVMPLCPYATAMFKKHPEAQDVLRFGSL